MGVYIKGIDLPKDAQAIQISYWTKDGHYIAESYPPSRIVEIPTPHGRLIDKDELLSHLKKDPLFSLVERYGVSGVIESRPTILAEE